MKISKIALLLFALLVLFAGCSAYDTPVVNEDAADAQLNQEISQLMDYYSQATISSDPAIVSNFTNYLATLDQKYGSNLEGEFLATVKPASRIGTGSDYPPLTNLPMNTDGDVYLSGGVSDATSAIVAWVCPNFTAGQYQHGAILDLNKFDPTNLDAPCFQSAAAAGALYETANQWMRNPNVVVMHSKNALNQSALNAQQNIMHQYCSGNIATAYGFFKDYANIFSIVTKEDNYYWYCTKVVWRVYKGLGIDIDSNTTQLNWSTSGLYSVVKAYYNTLYFWSSSTAKSKLNSYIESTRKTIVVSDEIYASPYLTKYYEVIRY